MDVTANMPDAWRRYLADGSKVVDLTAPEAYEAVPLIRRVVDLRAAAVSSVPFSLTRRQKPVDWPLPIAPREFLYNIERDMCVFGAAYVAVSRVGRRILDLQFLRPSAVSVVALADGFVFQYASVRGMEQLQPGEDVWWFWEWNPTSDIAPGAGVVESVLPAARVLYAATLMVSTFYVAGGMPATLVVAERGFGKDEAKVREFFRRLVRGVVNAFRVLTLSGKVEIKNLTPPLKDMVIADITEQATREVAWGAGIHETMLTEAANYATAREHRVSFWRDTIVPRAQQLEAMIQRQVFEPLGMVFRFEPERLDVLQQDELQRSRAVMNLVQAGFALPLAAQVAGYDEEVVAQLVEPDVAGGEQLRAELRAWRKVSKKSLRRALAFEVKAIPRPLAEMIRRLVKRGYVVKASRESYERKLRQAIAEALAPYGEQARGAWSQGQPYQVDQEEMRHALENALHAVLWDVMDGRTVELADEVGMFPLNDDDITVLHDKLAEAVRWAAETVTQTTAKMVEKVNSDLVANGEVDAALARIPSIFGDSRAELVAVTELSRARSAATNVMQDRFRQWGVDTRRVWLTANDELVCPICSQYHEQPEDVWREQYPDGPPAHPRCRCDIGLEVTAIGGEQI